MQDNENEQSVKSRGVRIRTINAAMIILTSLIAFVFLQTAQSAAYEYEALDQSTDDYIACEKAADNLMKASTYLTGKVRLFVTTGDVAAMNAYFEELDTTRRRDIAVETLNAQHPDTQASESLSRALRYSDELAKREMYAIKLTVSALDLHVDPSIAQRLDDIAYEAGDEDLSPDEKRDKAQFLVVDPVYEQGVNQITASVDACISQLETSLENAQQEHARTLELLLVRQQALTYILLIVVFATILLVVFMVLWPMQGYITRIGQNERLHDKGSFEMRFLSRAYNAMYDESARTRTQLLHEAEHDGLTGLYNRGAFEKLLKANRHANVALIMFDVDRFKSVNDHYGHDCGDRVLKNVARLIQDEFRSTDHACRLGGDEFAVIMNDVTSDQEGLIREKASHIVDQLSIERDDMPAATLSIGVAFGSDSVTPEKLYKNADKALYHVKDGGRNGIAFYDTDCDGS